MTSDGQVEETTTAVDTGTVSLHTLTCYIILILIAVPIDYSSAKLERCITDMEYWMSANRLRQNYCGLEQDITCPR